MTPSERLYLIFLGLIIILKLIAYVPGSIMVTKQPGDFPAWIKSGSVVMTLWHWRVVPSDTELYRNFLVLFSLVTLSLALSLFSLIPGFVHMRATLLFTSFSSLIVSGVSILIYFVVVLNGLKLTADIKLLGISFWLYLAAVAFEAVNLITAMAVYKRRDSASSSKWGRF